MDDKNHPTSTVAPAKSAAFTFIGDKDGHGPEKLSMFGYDFVKGKPTMVKAEDKHAIAKLTGNSHFKAG